MDDAYRLAMRGKVAELEEELQQLQGILREQGYVTTLQYRAIERNLQLLIESCIGTAKQTLKAMGKHVPAEARQVFEKLKAEGKDDSDIPWRAVIGMRNALVHGYLNIDRDRIIAVVKHDHYRSLIDFVRTKTV